MSRQYFSKKKRTVKSVPIYTDGKVVGIVRNGVFHKSIASNHYLRIPPAIAFSVESIDQALRAGATVAEVRDKGTGAIFRASIQHVLQKGKLIDRGYGPQLALPLDMWAKESKEMPSQPSLFGGMA